MRVLKIKSEISPYLGFFEIKAESYVNSIKHWINLSNSPVAFVFQGKDLFHISIINEKEICWKGNIPYTKDRRVLSRHQIIDGTKEFPSLISLNDSNLICFCKTFEEASNHLQWKGKIHENS